MNPEAVGVTRRYGYEDVEIASLPTSSFPIRFSASVKLHMRGSRLEAWLPPVCSVRDGYGNCWKSSGCRRGSSGPRPPLQKSRWCGHRVIAATRPSSHDAAIRALTLGGLHLGGASMGRFVGLDVSQKLTSICVVDDTGRRVWRGQCASDPEQIARLINRYARDAAGIGIETGPMTHGLCMNSARAGSMSPASMPDTRVPSSRCR
jgi:hypothetical protein